MKRATPILCLLLWLGICCPQAPADEPQPQTVRALGAVTVALPLAEALEPLKKEQNISILMRAEPSGMALEALGDRFVNIALSSREVGASDRAASPEIHFTETPIGMQFVAMAVSRDVWQGGVHALSANQARDIYEGKITNWKEVGGPDQKIRVYMILPGRGLREMFLQWLYGEIKKAPEWKGETVKDFQETRNSLDFTLGSLALLPPSCIDNRTIFALGVKGETGSLVEATLANALKEKYPLSRPLLMVTDDRPTGPSKTVIDFMIGERGQAFVKKFGYITLDELNAAKEDQ